MRCVVKYWVGLYYYTKVMLGVAYFGNNVLSDHENPFDSKSTIIAAADFLAFIWLKLRHIPKSSDEELLTDVLAYHVTFLIRDF